MKKLILISLLIGALPLSMVAQDDDLYFVPKKSSKVERVNDDYGLPRETYYSGSNRSVDDYNRRLSTYVPIDSASSDIIDFDGELGVYPDSLDDYKLTKKMERFDDYSLSDNAAYWAGYQEGRHDLWWHSPWYYRTYGWYNWYDPWYYSSWRYGIYDPWYYGPYSWYGGWWYDPWYYGSYWGYPYYRYGYAYWGGGGRRVSYNDHAGTIHMDRGNMNGRIYSSASAGGVRSSGGSTRLGAQRTSSLRNRTVGNHSAYTPSTNSRTAAETTRRAATTYTPSNTTSGGSIGGGGFSSGGARSSGGGGGFSGGGGGRSAGGHAGGRR